MNGSTNLTTEDLYEEIFTSYQEGTNRTSIETATKLINADELLHNDLIYNYSQLTPSQERAVAYTPKVTAVLSLLGSAWIVYDLCLRDTKHVKLKTTYHRLILSMSLIDILSSSWLFIGTWAVPVHYSFNAYGNAGYKVAGASGNEASCEAQGFFLTLGMATPLYNVALALYSLLVARYGWKETKIQRPWLSSSYSWCKHFNLGTIMLVLPIVFSATMAVLGLVWNMYNLQPTTYNCWIAPLPIRCDPFIVDDVKHPKISGNEDYTPPEDRPACIRGANANVFRLVAVFWPLWLACAGMVICMVLIVHKVVVLERATNRWKVQFQNFTGTSTAKDDNRNNTDRNTDNNNNNNDIKNINIGTSNSKTNVKESDDNGCEDREERRNKYKRLSSLSAWIGRKDPTSTGTKYEPERRSTNQTMAANKKLFPGNTKKSRKVVAQALFFVTAFLAAWIPYMGYTLFRYLNNMYAFDDLFGALMVSSVLLPAQGFFNFLVFIRPRWIQYYDRRQRIKRRKRNGHHKNCDKNHNKTNDGKQSGTDKFKVRRPIHVALSRMRHSVSTLSQNIGRTRTTTTKGTTMSTQQRPPVGDIESPCSSQKSNTHNTKLLAVAIKNNKGTIVDCDAVVSESIEIFEFGDLTMSNSLRKIHQNDDSNDTDSPSTASSSSASSHQDDDESAFADDDDFDGTEHSDMTITNKNDATKISSGAKVLQWISASFRRTSTERSLSQPCIADEEFFIVMDMMKDDKDNDTRHRMDINEGISESCSF